MKEIIKRYTSDGITVVWQPSKCIHSKICFHGLPAVFNPENRPWVTMEETTSEDIIAQVRQCPSGALSIEENMDSNADVESGTQINVTQGGPLLVTGDLVLTLPNGEQLEKQGVTALCRCGASANKPYCDGSHARIKFDT